VDSVKKRYNNMFGAYKKYKAQLAIPPTGGGRMPVKKPFFDLFDDLLASDCRIDGISTGVPLEYGFNFLLPEYFWKFSKTKNKIFIFHESQNKDLYIWLIFT